MTNINHKDLIILEIYNRYSHGEITTEERNMLFNKCDEVFNEAGNINRLQKTIEMFDESTKYDKYLNDVNEIISKLSKEESNYIGRGQWVDSEYVIYRKVEYNNNIPIAFIDVYLMPKYENTGLIVIAVSKDARGKGIGKELVKGAINSLKSNKDIDRLRWKVDSNNKISINMAESLGFELSETTKKEKIYYYNL